MRMIWLMEQLPDTSSFIGKSAASLPTSRRTSARGPTSTRRPGLRSRGTTRCGRGRGASSTSATTSSPATATRSWPTV
uniref:Uncharacterized protein n=1 Tax=Arundo donax TaxID=35708 RepID=A0A0A9H570_ARUDO